MKTIFNLNKIMALALTIIVMNFSLTAQVKWKKYFFTGSSQFVSGMLDGTIESISYHYESGFKTRFPKANDQFWNPALSWKNKYKEGNSQLGAKFTGSTTIFACSTDAYHLLRTAKRSSDLLSLAYYVNNEYAYQKNNRFASDDGMIIKKPQKRWKRVVKDFAILTAIRCAGFHFTYSLLFKPQKNFQYK